MKTPQLKLLTVKDKQYEKIILSFGFDTFNKHFIKESIFPITSDQLGIWEYKVFSIPEKKTINWKAVIELMEQEGFKPAKIGHLISFFVEGNYIKKEGYRYVAMGSKKKYTSIIFSPHFCKCENKWELDVSNVDLYFDKSSNIYFLAVKTIGKK